MVTATTCKVLVSFMNFKDCFYPLRVQLLLKLADICDYTLRTH